MGCCRSCEWDDRVCVDQNSSYARTWRLFNSLRKLMPIPQWSVFESKPGINAIRWNHPPRRVIADRWHSVSRAPRSVTAHVCKSFGCVSLLTVCALCLSNEVRLPTVKPSHRFPIRPIFALGRVSYSAVCIYEYIRKNQFRTFSRELRSDPVLFRNGAGRFPPSLRPTRSTAVRLALLMSVNWPDGGYG